MSGSLKKALQIVEYVASRQGEVRQVDIQKDLEMKKTTAHRYFESLEEMNFLEKKNNFYYLGLGLLRLGNKVESRNLIVNRVNSILERIVSEVNETVNLAQFNGETATYLHRVESRRNLQFRATLGDNLPLYCTSLGKSILSLLPDEQIVELMKNMAFNKYTQNTITDKKALIKQIKEIRKQGFAIEEEEFEEGLICVSVPFYLENYDFIGAISFSGTTNRMNKEQLVKLIDKVIPYVAKMKNKFE